MIGVTGNRSRSALVVCIMTVMLFSCGLALASSGGAHAEGSHDSGQMKDLLYRFINFALLVIILVVVIRKTTIKDFFAARRSEIEEKFRQLKAEKESAAKRHADLERKLKDFEKEKAQILAQFKAEGAAEKEKIIAEAKERAAQIMAQAEMTIQREMDAARDRLKQEIVEASADRARDLIARNMRDADQDHLVTEFIDKVEKLH
jgi:F-type H+-transporting ATPase subunit b